MINIIDKSKCTGCTACAVSCPMQCIRMVKDQEGFLYPGVNERDCIHCGLCEKSCPLIVGGKERNYSEVSAYAAQNRDPQIVRKSSSGGVFSALSAYVMQQGGVVIGAGFDKDFSVVHMCIEKEEDLPLLRGSKYVQSTLGQVYTQAKEYLNGGRWVLFSGTPCQISGLYRFLKKDYEKLITQDIVCHGVPSPLVWEKYLAYQRRKKHNGQISSVSFRDKVTGWKGYSLTVEYENSNKYSCLASQDLMMKAFLKNLCLRPSCYDCAFKQRVKESDLTVADFWGVEYLLPKWNDDSGVSLVLINSSKGKEIFSKIRSQIDACEVDFDEAMKYNPSAICSVPKPDDRDKFMATIETRDFKYVAHKYLKKPFLKKLKRKIKGLMTNL